MKRGFTLLEVMVGLAILAVGLVAIIGINGGTIRSHNYAKRLTIATMLARSKMVDIESHFNKEGFTSEFDQVMEGDFSEEGWKEFRWRAEIVKPELDAANTTALVSTLIETMLGGVPEKDSNDFGPDIDMGSMMATVQPMIENQITTMVELMKSSLREVRLVVSWKDGTRDETLDVVTHLVILPQQPGSPPPPEGLQPPQQPGGQQ